MNRRCSAGFDLRKRLFFDGCDDDVHALRSCGVEDQEREFAVAGNQA
jgi:hypothetical protein